MKEGGGYLPKNPFLVLNLKSKIMKISRIAVVATFLPPKEGKKMFTRIVGKDCLRLLPEMYQQCLNGKVESIAFKKGEDYMGLSQWDVDPEGVIEHDLLATAIKLKSADINAADLEAARLMW